MALTRVSKDIKGAGCAVIDGAYILVGIRQKTDQLQLPGGMVGEGESALQTAVRETYEETGLRVKVRDVLMVFYLNNSRKGSGYHVIFKCDAIKNASHHEGPVDQGEVADTLWLDPYLMEDKHGTKIDNAWRFSHMYGFIKSWVSR